MMFPMSTLWSRHSTGRSKNYHHGNLREALLDSARALAAEGNIDEFHLREVARRAGVSHTAAYNHFADKAALVEALVIEAFAALAADLHAAADSCDEPIRRLEQIGCAYVLFAYRNPAEFRFMWRPELCVPRPAARDGDASRPKGASAYQVLVEAIAAALDSGSIAGNRETLVLAAWSAVHGLAALLLDGPQRVEAQTLEEVESLARGVTRTLITGMLARPMAPS